MLPRFAGAERFGQHQHRCRMSQVLASTTRCTECERSGNPALSLMNGQLR
jgi:hypothetical protein